MTRPQALWTLLATLAVTASGCAFPGQSHNLPPAERLFGPGPGVSGPGPGVLAPQLPSLPPQAMPASQQTVQLLFSDTHQMEGMQVFWDVSGTATFDSEPLIIPGRQNFPQGGIFRLKLTNIPGREGLELYPTIEVASTTGRTEAYLAHNAVPIEFTNEDFDQIESNNFVTKVIYLPDPEFQVLAQAGIETLVSTRLDPGVDPIVEADRRGSIMSVIRIGNKDIELPGTSPDNGVNGGIAPIAFTNMLQQGNGVPMPMMPTAVGHGGMMPPHVSGVTTPAWGMPMSGTPIGLPGPPHIPHGFKAGLQSHTMTNRTRTYIPEPTTNFHINLRQQPGFSYPRPASRVNIREQTIHPPVNYKQPFRNRSQKVN
ncbi:MAG: hypothetical protein MK165_07890 [Pirellulaceae bacterium]|nr:hypothetical protein [Pirellulaceae bacterium]